jgi:hypothetical protein
MGSELRSEPSQTRNKGVTPAVTNVRPVRRIYHRNSEEPLEALTKVGAVSDRSGNQDLARISREHSLLVCAVESAGEAGGCGIGENEGASWAGRVGRESSPDGWRAEIGGGFDDV